jgi:hypothetical protein
MAQAGLLLFLPAALDSFIVRVFFPAVLVEIFVKIVVEFLVFLGQSERPARFRLAY